LSPGLHRRSWLALALVAAAAPGCRHAQPPPLRFVDSPAFAEVRRSTFGLLERDLDGDALSDVVVADKSGDAWAAVAYRHTRNEQGDQWTRACRGEAVSGAELDRILFVEMEDGPLVLLVAAEENPDEVIQSFVLVDAAAGCATVAADRLTLTRPGGALVAPDSVPAGVVVGAQSKGLKLVDRPSVVHLEGAEGPVDLLVSVRVRELGGPRATPNVGEAVVALLEPRQLTVTAATDTAAAPVLPELSDGDDATSLALRRGEGGRVRLAAAAPLVALEVHHGCTGEEAAPPLALRSGSGPAVILGTVPAADAFVRAVGRSHGGAAGRRRDLILLRDAAAELQLEIQGADGERCVSEIRGFGYR
jgi:hypothetical protein